jgi:hypothetical protein
MAEVLACDRCGEIVRPEPELHDRQGGRVDVRYPAYTQRLVLCSRCIGEATLGELRTLGLRLTGGTLPTHEALEYLPVYG